MELTIAGSTVTRAFTDDQLSRVSIELSADGREIGVGTMPLDDPAGTDEHAGGRQLRVDQGTTLLSDGFIAMQDRLRSGAKPRREDVYSIQDANALLYGRRFVNRSRPAETDQERVLAFAATDLPSADTTWVLGTNTVSLPAKAYTGIDWTELIQDVSEAAGKVVFLHDKADGTGRCLHSHKETEGHSCGLSISDDPADLSPTVYAPWNPNRNRTEGELANNVYGRDQAGRTSTDSDATSISAHDADGKKHETIVDFEASSQAELDSKVSNYLDENKVEIDIYECDIGPLDQAALRLIRPGDRITVTSQAMALSASTIRIAHMVLTHAKADDGSPLPHFWMAHLELNQAIRLRSKTSSGGKVKPPPAENPPFVPMGTDDASGLDRAWGVASNQSSTAGPSFNVSGDSDNIIGIILGVAITAENSSGAFPTVESESRLFIQHEAPSGALAARFRARIWGQAFSSPAPTEDYDWQMWMGPWHLAAGGATTLPRAIQVATDPVYEDIGATIASGSFTPAAFDATVMVGFDDIDVVVPVVDGYLRVVFGFAATQTTLNASEYGGTTSAFVGSRYPIAANRDAQDIIFLQDGIGTSIPVGSSPVTGYSLEWLPGVKPKPGQWIFGEAVGTGDGTTTAHTVVYGGYAPGSLHAYTDDLRELNIIETDPSVGDWAFVTAPFVGEVLTIDYMGAP